MRLAVLLRLQARTFVAAFALFAALLLPLVLVSQLTASRATW